MGQITVSGLAASYDKVEILGRNTNWQVVLVCDGNCTDMQIIPNLQAGEYSVKVNQGGNDGTYCYREEKVTVQTGSPDRLSPYDKIFDELVLYPNPAREEVTIKIPRVEEVQTGQIQIFDTFGRVVKNFPAGEFKEDVMRLDLSDFENGMYWVTLQIGKRRVVGKRLVVETLK